MDRSRMLTLPGGIRGHRQTSGTLGLALGARWRGTPYRSVHLDRRSTLRHVLAVVLLALLLASGCGLAGAGSAPSAAGPQSKVIVRTVPGQEQVLERRVSALGGKVATELPIIHGFSATMPQGALTIFSHEVAVLSVTPDASVSLNGTYDPSTDAYSMQNVDRAVRASRFWDAGFTGAGVDIALIDSGVAPVQGLNTPGKIIHGPDLSFESQAPNLRNLDAYGHGTHMAGIMAGRDPGVSPSSYSSDTRDFLGVAPDARIVSVKVADSHGNADVSQVIAGIDWVVQHAHDPGLNIEVLNLSFGTTSSQSYILDPLAFAAETAWRRGVTIVASVGNAGRSAAGLADPAYDPYLLSVGAADHHGSMQYSQWDVASFSQIGDGLRNPDLLAPGAHLQSLRVPGSYLDQTYPGGVIGDRFFRGSGSSQATAVVSGALALLFQKHPSMSPDQAKALITDQANSLRPSSGFGVKQGQRALRLDTALVAGVPLAKQLYLQSTGLGSLEGARGAVHLAKSGIALQGEQDIFGARFDAAVMAALEAAGNSWMGGRWNGNQWAGNEWQGNEWQGNEWQGVSWSGNSWMGNEWASNQWAGNEWQGNEWQGNEWCGNEWAAGAWSSASWS